MQRISDKLASEGALIIGNLELLPDGPWGILAVVNTTGGVPKNSGDTA